MVGCEIRGEFVEVWFRNRLSYSQQFLPYRARLFGLGRAATLAATFWRSGTRGGSYAHDGWNYYSGESLRCLRVAEELFPFLPLSSCRVTRLPFTARVQRAQRHRARCASTKGGLVALLFLLCPPRSWFSARFWVRYSRQVCGVEKRRRSSRCPSDTPSAHTRIVSTRPTGFNRRSI